MAEKTALEIEEIIRRLRDICPWNARQTPLALLELLESEVSELREALNNGATWHISEELGDILFNFISIVECFNARGIFSLADIDHQVSNKMIGRHPYVFDGASDPGPELANVLWEARKAEERQTFWETRIGVFIACDVHEVGCDAFASKEWMRNTLVNLCELAGMRDRPSVNIDEPCPGGGHCLGILAGPSYLLLQAFPHRKLALLQGFTINQIDAAGMRSYLAKRFLTEQIEMLLLDRGYSKEKLES